VSGLDGSILAQAFCVFVILMVSLLGLGNCVRKCDCSNLATTIMWQKETDE